jgi:hypothetical protein
MASIGLFFSVEAVLTAIDSGESIFAGIILGMGLAFFIMSGSFRGLEKDLESE